MVLRPLVSVWFQVLFHPLFKFFSPFLHGTWFTIGLSGVFSLGGWSPDSDRVSRVPPYSGYHYVYLSITGLSPFGYSVLSRTFFCIKVVVTTQNCRKTLVWANPLSLATTYGISLFFSSAYLDVSVPGLLPCWVTYLQHVGCPIRISTDQFCLPIPAAFRSLPRPSSPLKARHPPYALNDFFPNILLVYFYFGKCSVISL